MARSDNQLHVQVTGEDNLSPILNQLESRVIRTVGAISAALAGIRIASAPITVAGDFERELANVQKTTEFTTNQIKQLSGELLNLSLRTDVATLDLAKIAAAAGQQGLGRTGVEGVVAFTDSVARMSSVLDVTAEEAGAAIGKIVNIFNLPPSAFEKVISSFNEVSNNSTATGEELIDIVKRIGDAARSIKLQDALGLAATGVDLGISPEVIGTAYTSIFSNLRAKADQFSKLVKMDVKDWLSLVETDGTAAFKKMLSSLRELNSQDQQTAIVKLLGGGRIGGFVTKLLQDTTDSTLNRNLANGASGYANGTSALKEQATVLNTLNGQSTLLLNTLFKIGNTVGDDTVGPLKSLVVELRQALDSDGFRSFANALGATLADIIGQVQKFGTWVGSLGINWENFLKVAKVFAQIKLAELIGGVALRSLGLSTALQSVAKSGKEAAASVASVGAAQGLGTRIATSSQLGKDIANTLAQLKQWRAAVQERNALQAEMAARQATVDALIPTVSRQQTVSNKGNFDQSAAKNAHAAAQAAQLAAVQDGAQRLTQLIAARDTSLAAKEAEHQTNLTNIQNRYEAARTAAKAAGDRTAARQAAATRDAEIAAEEASYQRRIRSTEAYHAKRIEMARAAALAEVNAANAALVAAEKAVEQAAARQAGKNANSAAAAATLAAAQAAVVETGTKLNAATVAADAAKASVVSLGAIGSTAMRLLAGAARLVAGAFFWVTIIYSIADAFGLLEKVPGIFTAITDAMGLTSKASRDLAVESQKRRDEMVKEEKQLKDLVDAYTRFQDRATGEVKKDTFTGITDRLKNSETAKERSDAVGDLSTIIVGANAREQSDNTTGTKATKGLDQARADLAKYQAEVDRLRATLGDKYAFMLGAEGVDSMNKALDDAQQKADAAQKNIDKFTKALTGVGPGAEAARRELALADEVLTTLFTKDTAPLVEKYIAPIKAAEEALKPLNEERVKALDALAAVPTTEGDAYDAAKARFDASIEAIGRQQAEVERLQNAFRLLRKQLEEMPGISNKTLGSLEFLSSLAVASNAQVAAVSARVTGMINAGVAFTGTAAANFTTPKATGSRDFNVKGDKGKEGYARRLAQAQLALAQAEARARQDFEKATLDSQQRREDEAYSRGLESLKDYYDGRREVQNKLIDSDIKAKEQELAQIDLNIKTASDEAERIKYRAERRKVTGQIDVLDNVTREDRQKQISEEERQARERQADEFRKLANDLARDLFPAPGGDSLDQYKQFYDEVLAENRKTFNEIDSAIREAYANGATDAAKSLEGLKAEMLALAQQRAVEQMFNRIRTQADLAADSFDRFNARLGQMQRLGAITGGEAEAAYRTMLSNVGPQLEAAIAASEAEMARLGDTTSATYQRMAADVDNMKLHLRDLQLNANATAIAVNDSIEGAIANGLTDLEFSFESLRTTSLKVLLDIANAIKAMLAKEIAQKWVRALTGGDKTKGPGGSLQNDVIGADAAPTANGIVNAALGKGPAGTFASPFFVKLVDGALNMANGVGTSLLSPGVFAGLRGTGANYDLNPGGVFNAFGTLDNSVGFDSGMDLSNTLGIFGGSRSSGGGGIFSEGSGESNSEGLFSALTPQVEGLGSGLLSTLQSGFGDVFGGSNGGFFGGLSNILGGITDSFSKMFSGAGAGASAGGGGDISGGLGMLGGLGGGWVGLGLTVANLAVRASQHHVGGVVGRGGVSRKIHPALFNGAAKFHEGGLPGLQTNEVPAILKKGEEVLTQNDPRNVLNGGKNGEGAQADSMNNPRFFLIDDRARIPELMASAEGGQAIMVHLRKNAAAVRQLVKG